MAFQTFLFVTFFAKKMTPKNFILVQTFLITQMIETVGVVRERPDTLLGASRSATTP